MNEHQPNNNHNNPEIQHEAANGVEREQHPDNLRPRIWVASLADYVNGHLHGDWFDASQDITDLQAQIQAMLDASPEPGAEEYGIFDYDEFGPFTVGEYETIETVTRVAAGIRAHGEAFAVWAQLHDADPGMLASFEDAYLGHYPSAKDWAIETLESLNPELFTRAFPESLQPYVRLDWELWLRDVKASGEIDIENATDGGVYIFQTL